MTQWNIHTQFDSDPRRNGKLRLIRQETDDGESHVIASGIKPHIAPILAAAPDMLAALTCCINMMEGEDLDELHGDLAEVVRAAIAKATGERP